MPCLGWTLVVRPQSRAWQKMWSTDTTRRRPQCESSLRTHTQPTFSGPSSFSEQRRPQMMSTCRACARCLMQPASLVMSQLSVSSTTQIRRLAGHSASVTTASGLLRAQPTRCVTLASRAGTMTAAQTASSVREPCLASCWLASTASFR